MQDEMAEQMAILGVPWRRDEEEDGTDMAWALLRAIQRRTRTYQDDEKTPADGEGKCGDEELQEAKGSGAMEGREDDGSKREKDDEGGCEESLALETEAPGSAVTHDVAEDKSDVDFRTGLLDYMRNRRLLNTRGGGGKMGESGLGRNEHDPVHWKFPSLERSSEDKESGGGGRAQEESDVTFLTAIDD
jgi:hypothetical protein